MSIFMPRWFIIFMFGALLVPSPCAAQANLDKEEVVKGWQAHPPLFSGPRFYQPRSLELIPEGPGVDIRLVRYHKPILKPFTAVDGTPKEREQGGYLLLRLRSETPAKEDGRFVPFIWKGLELRTGLAAPGIVTQDLPPSLDGVETFDLTRTEVDVLTEGMERTEGILLAKLRCEIVYAGYRKLPEPLRFHVKHKLLAEALDKVSESGLLDLTASAPERFLKAALSNKAITPVPSEELSPAAREALFSAIRKNWLRYDLIPPAGSRPGGKVDLPLDVRIKPARFGVAFSAFREDGDVRLEEWAYVERPLPVFVTLPEKPRCRRDEVAFGTNGVAYTQKVVFFLHAKTRRESGIEELLIEVAYQEKGRPTSRFAKVLPMPAKGDELTIPIQMVYPAKGQLKYRLLATIRARKGPVLRQGSWHHPGGENRLFAIPTCYVFPDLRELLDEPATPSP